MKHIKPHAYDKQCRCSDCQDFEYSIAYQIKQEAKKGKPWTNLKK